MYSMNYCLEILQDFVKLVIHPISTPYIQQLIHTVYHEMKLKTHQNLRWR